MLLTIITLSVSTYLFYGFKIRQIQIYMPCWQNLQRGMYSASTTTTHIHTHHHLLPQIFCLLFQLTSFGPIHPSVSSSLLLPWNHVNVVWHPCPMWPMQHSKSHIFGCNEWVINVCRPFRILVAVIVEAINRIDLDWNWVVERLCRQMMGILMMMTMYLYHYQVDYYHY